MPSQYNLPITQAPWSEQDVNLYNKLPFYLALQQAKHFPEWATYNKLLGTTPWQPNQGTTMKGVIVEPTPIGRQFIYPNPITQQAKKDVFTQLERTNEAVIYRHKFESQQFNFLPSFQDFRKKQIKTAQADIDRQIIWADDVFARTTMFDLSPYMFISGKAIDANGDFEVIPAPSMLSNDDRTIGKSTAFMQYACSLVGNNKGNLSLKVMNKLLSIMREDIQAPAWEGMVNTVKDNETIKGRYVIVGSDEAFSQLTFDEHILNFKPLNMNLLNDEFSGVLFDRLAYKVERFPLRVAADGTFPVPQLYVGGDSGAYNLYETVPNPDYVNAPFEIAFIMGANPYDKINVGPPPAEFAGGRISEEKFNRLFWNGETKITDDVLVQISSGVVDTNKYGEELQIISALVFGMIPVNKRYCMPVLYRRWRVETN
jgi:hypothetical protein